MIAQVIRCQLPAVPPDPNQVTRTKRGGATAVPALGQQAAAGSTQHTLQAWQPQKHQGSSPPRRQAASRHASSSGPARESSHQSACPAPHSAWGVGSRACAPGSRAGLGAAAPTARAWQGPRTPARVRPPYPQGPQAPARVRLPVVGNQADGGLALSKGFAHVCRHEAPHQARRCRPGPVPALGGLPPPGHRPAHLPRVLQPVPAMQPALRPVPPSQPARTLQPTPRLLVPQSPPQVMAMARPAVALPSQMRQATLLQTTRSPLALPPQPQPGRNPVPHSCLRPDLRSACSSSLQVVSSDPPCSR